MAKHLKKSKVRVRSVLSEKGYRKESIFQGLMRAIVTKIATDAACSEREQSYYIGEERGCRLYLVAVPPRAGGPPKWRKAGQIDENFLSKITGTY